MNAEKKCCRCKEIFPITEFHNNKARRDGKSPECRYCRSDIDRKRTKTMNQRKYDLLYRSLNGLSKKIFDVMNPGEEVTPNDIVGRL